MATTTGKAGYVMFADPSWRQFHELHSVGQMVAYLRGSGAPMKTLPRGAPVFLIQKAEKPYRVHAWGLFEGDHLIAVKDAWPRFGSRLGAGTQESHNDMLRGLPNVRLDGEVRLIQISNFSVPQSPVEMDPGRVYMASNAPKGWGLKPEDVGFLLSRLSGQETKTVPDTEILIEAGTEGRRILAAHLRIERNSNLISAAKRHWLAQDPMLRCACCGFSFRETYGELGDGFVEAHHIVPLAESAQSGPVETAISSLVPVCSNCHRMLHSRGGRGLDVLRRSIHASRIL
jgi:hypothetical protein